MNYPSCILMAAAAALTVGCVSTSSVGYRDGWVTTSPVSYEFVGPPVLRDVQGRTYSVNAGANHSGDTLHVSPFDKKGMRPVSGGGDVQIEMAVGAVRQGQPGAIRVGKTYYPTFTISVPYEVSIHRGGAELTRRTGVYDNALTFKNGQRFDSREKAIAAIDTIRKLGQKGIEDRARAAALQEAQKSTHEVASSLFEERNISLEVPVVRSAAGVDLEPCYTMLAEAKNPEQVQRALQAFERIGTDHRKPDGSHNQTANYGVACGIAAAKLLLRDLRGAWTASQLANQFEANGEEVDQIRYVIYQQEKITGLAVIPEADRKKIRQHEQMAEALEKVFASPGR